MPFFHNQQNKVTIIGAGWLGKPLAYHLVKQGFNVITTQRHILNDDPNNATKPFQQIVYSDLLLQKILGANEEGSAQYQSLCQQLFMHRTVIITIPPSGFIEKNTLSKDTDSRAGAAHQVDNFKIPLSYRDMILHTAKLAADSGAIEIVFTSSTSVYGHSSGIIHEGLPALPQTENAKAIRLAEKALESEITIPVTILRLAGLIGNGRHPIHYLSGRKDIASPFDAINLLHIDDLISAITAILKRDKPDNTYDIYNIVSPYHPNRQSYYQTLATMLSIAPPQFETPKPLLKKIIDGGKITEAGDFCYRKIDLLDTTLNQIL